MEVIKRRSKFDDKDSDFFVFGKRRYQIKKKNSQSPKKLTNIKVSNNILENCAKLCLALGSDGLRGELTY